MKQYIGNGLFAEWDGERMLLNTRTGQPYLHGLDVHQMLELNRFWQLCMEAKRMGLFPHSPRAAGETTVSPSAKTTTQPLSLALAASIVYGKDHYAQALPSWQAKA